MTKNLPAFFKIVAAVGMGMISISTIASPARAALIYNESTDAIGGDLSNNRLNPNFIGQLTGKSNFLTFTLNNPEDSTGELRILRDLDYFFVTIPSGFVLNKLILTQYDPTIGGLVTPGTDQIAFVGLQQGRQFTEPAQPSECPILGQTNCDPVPAVFTDPANLLGYTLIGTEDAAGIFAGVSKPGEDLLPPLGATIRPNQPNGDPSPIPNGGLGFLPPLAAGDYVFWAQQTAPGKVTVQLNFVVSSVSSIPEPTSAIALLALGGLGVVSRWKRHKQDC